MERRIKLTITDLDNTLYDWVTFFARSLDAMVQYAAPLVGVPVEVLLDDLRAVHQKHHNSEQPFALLETDSVRQRFPTSHRRELFENLRPAFEAFNLERKRTLSLYPGVRETLESISATGCPIVAHTEASAVNAVWRLRELGIAGFITKLFAVQLQGDEHPDPAHQPTTDLFEGKLRLLGPHERKPDVQVLRDICANCGVAERDTLYVGDSLSRDIGMAKEAGTLAAWAKYGTRFDPEMWKKLVRVTHWTKSDVDRAQRAQELYGHVQPDATLDRGFDELLDHFSFGN